MKSKKLSKLSLMCATTTMLSGMAFDAQATAQQGNFEMNQQALFEEVEREGFQRLLKPRNNRPRVSNTIKNHVADEKKGFVPYVEINPGIREHFTDEVKFLSPLLKEIPNTVDKDTLKIALNKVREGGQKLSIARKVQILETIKSNGWHYNADDILNIPVNTNLGFEPSKQVKGNDDLTLGYKSTFIEGNTYKIQYFHIGDNEIKEIDVTDTLIAAGKTFEMEGIRKFKNEAMTLEQLQEKEKEELFTQLKENIETAVINSLNIAKAVKDIQVPHNQTRDNNILYYDNFLIKETSEDEYKKYLTPLEIKGIKEGRGMVLAYEQKKAHLQKAISENNLSQEQVEEFINEHYGEVFEYECSLPGKGNKVSQDIYEKEIFHAAKKRAVNGYIKNMEKRDLSSKKDIRMTIEKQDGTLECITTNQFAKIIHENPISAQIPDLSAIEISVDKVMKPLRGGRKAGVLPVNEAVQKLEAENAKLLKENAKLKELLLNRKGEDILPPVPPLRPAVPVPAPAEDGVNELVGNLNNVNQNFNEQGEVNNNLGERNRRNINAEDGAGAILEIFENELPFPNLEDVVLAEPAAGGNNEEPRENHGIHNHDQQGVVRGIENEDVRAGEGRGEVDIPEREQQEEGQIIDNGMNIFLAQEIPEQQIGAHGGVNVEEVEEGIDVDQGNGDRNANDLQAEVNNNAQPRIQQQHAEGPQPADANGEGKQQRHQELPQNVDIVHAAEDINAPVVEEDARAAVIVDDEALPTPNKETENDDALRAKKEAQEEAEKLALVLEEVTRAEEAKIAEAVETATMQMAVKEDKDIIGAIYNSNIVHNVNHLNSNTILSRITHTTLPMVAVAAGDDERVLDKGIWLSGIYGTNKQGAQKEFAGYKGHTAGGTIGFDVGFDNDKDLVGIAYTKLDSKFKFKDNDLNTKIDSHIIALYGQKELPKNFMMQAMFAYNHNIIKNKINRSGTIASGKYKNNNYNFEGLLSYNYLANNAILFTPNIGIKYGYSKDGQYQESDVGMQRLGVAAKKQNLWSGILGGKVALVPQKITDSISITPTLQASVENYFNDKSKKLNATIKWKDKEVKESVVLPKQPKIGYNLGASILTEKGNVSVLLEYNCHLQKKYQSHQGFVKLKIKL